MCISKLSSKDARLVFVATVGNDAYGRDMRQLFRTNHFVDVDQNIITVDSVNGTASIFVEKDTGKNFIVLVGGSNVLINNDMVDKSWEDIKQCKVLVCQNEIPLSVTYHALKKAKEEGLITIFNPAPAVNLLTLPSELADIGKYVDFLIPNETEAPVLIGRDIESSYVEEDSVLETLCQEIQEKTQIPNIILTLGERGCAALYKTETGERKFQHVKGEKVENVVDTTGAGDAWVGSFAYFLSCDIPTEESMGLSNFIASITVQYKGAQMSYNSLNQSTILSKFVL